jgi:hypothetical protein
MASVSAFHAEAWAAAVSWPHGHGARHNSDKGVDRMPPTGSHSVQARLRTRGERWAVGARVGSSGDAGGRAGLPSSLIVCRDDPRREQPLIQEAAGRGYSVGLSFMR